MKFRSNREHPFALLVILGLIAACSSEAGEGLQGSDPVEDLSVNELGVGKTRIPLDLEFQGQTVTELSVTDIGGSQVQFRVRSSSPFQVRSLDPLVQIGDAFLGDYGYEDRNKVLVYTADLSELPDRGQVTFGWGGGRELSVAVTTDCVFLKATRSLGIIDR